MRRLPGRPVALLAAGLALAGPLAAAELDQHGRAHEWQGPQGRPAIIDFAASWCALARRHPEVRVLVVSVDERREGRDRLVESLGLTVPVLWDAEHRIAEHYRPRALPATFVLSAAGEVAGAVTGSRARDFEQVVRLVETLSAGPRPAP
jgi:hypothetical protein